MRKRSKILGLSTDSAPADVKLKKPCTEDTALLIEKTLAEVLHKSRKMFDGLTPHERSLITQYLSEAMVSPNLESDIHDLLWELDFLRKPVSVTEFIENDDYFGRSCADLHPRWKEDLSIVFATGSPIFEWLMCVPGDTLIPLLDGATKSIKDLHLEHTLNGGKPVWVYSYDQKGRKMVAGEATKVIKFGEDQLYKVTLDDGTCVRANADHEFVCRDGLKRKLRDLKVGDRLMPFVTRNKRQGGQRLHSGYEQVYEPETGNYTYTHRMSALVHTGGVDQHTFEGDRAVVHHVDFNCKNNDPSNLKWMGFAAHRDLHAHASYRSPERRANSSALGTARATDPGSPLRKGHLRFMRSAKGRKLACANLAKWAPPPGEYKRRLVIASSTRWADPEQRRAASKRCAERNKGNTWGRKRARTDVTVSDLYTTFESSRNLRELYIKLKVSRNAVVRILRDAGLTIRDLKTGYRNHQIQKIEKDKIETVYCLQVPAYGNFAIVTDPKNRSGIISGNTGGIGIGKTTVSCAALGYKIYYMSCMRDPSSYYGLLRDSMIVFGLYSITKRQVNDSGYFKLRGFIDSSPYFRNIFPRNQRLDTKIMFDKLNMQVLSGSTELHSIGLDLFAFMMDEVNFMRVKTQQETGVVTGQAYQLYNSTHSRLRSRFMRPGGNIPGLMLLLSSRNAQTSFLEEHLKKVGNSSSTYVSDYPIWEVKPAHKYVLPRFKVEVGDRVSRSRILTDKDKPRLGARVIDVPGEFLEDFTIDVDQGLREVAGIATFNLSPLIRDRQSVFDAYRDTLSHPFTKDTVICGIGDMEERIDHYFKLPSVCCVSNSKWIPKLNPLASRFIHVDIGLTGDALGMAMSHVSGMIRHERSNPDGTSSVIESPFIVNDFMLQVLPPVGGEIDLGKIRSFIIYLSRVFPLALVTFDGFQSVDSVQILNKSGINAEKLSVDISEDKYLSLRAALFERRIAMYKYPIYEVEVLDLIRNVKDRKVDHPQKNSAGGKGSKDVTDALCGSVWHCVTDSRAIANAAPLVFDNLSKPKSSEGVDPRLVPTPNRIIAGTELNWDALRGNATS